MAIVTFNDDTSIEVLHCISGREYMLGSEREFLDLVFDGENTEYNDIKELYKNKDILSQIRYTETFEDGSVTTIDYTDYNIPVNIICESRNNSFVITLKIAKKTLAEEREEELTSKNKEIQLALIELAQSYADLEERLNALEKTEEV